ncbi:methylase [Salmonella enterica subsp. arizonae]|uniref:Methyltransferase n=1 Tax=Salmonella enterica subsp. arizonae TaxID=59203 RepID=A0A379XIG8_SALER|nr:methylase [Salmonella enterica subsp. arizonae]
MSRLIQGNCVDIMSTFPDRAVDFILTDPPYLVGFRDRSGRSIAGDKTDEWLQPACNQMYRVLKKDSLLISFYGWNRVDRFMAAWKSAGFSVVGHLVFTKNYSSKSAYVGYRHECAYILAKGRPDLPQNPLPDVLGWKYSGNRHHPTEKPVTSLQPLIESFTHPGAIVLDPFAGSASTCVAALQAGRRYIGIELMEQYHRAGQQRLAAVQQAMQRRRPTMTGLSRRPPDELRRKREVAGGGGVADQQHVRPAHHPESAGRSLSLAASRAH